MAQCQTPFSATHPMSHKQSSDSQSPIARNQSPSSFQKSQHLFSHGQSPAIVQSPAQSSRTFSLTAGDPARIAYALQWKDSASTPQRIRSDGNSFPETESK